MLILPQRRDPGPEWVPPLPLWVGPFADRALARWSVVMDGTCDTHPLGSGIARLEPMGAPSRGAPLVGTLTRIKMIVGPDD